MKLSIISDMSKELKGFIMPMVIGIIVLSIWAIDMMYTSYMMKLKLIDSLLTLYQR